MVKFHPPYDTFSNKDKKIYIANKNEELSYDDWGNSIVTYQKPFYYGKKNYQPLSYRELRDYKEEYGEVSGQVCQLLVDAKDRNVMKSFDVAYLYGATPDGEERYGDNANFIVKAVREQNTKMAILLEEIINEEE